MPYVSDWMSIREACANIAGVEGCDSISALRQLRSAYLDGKIRSDRQWKTPGEQLKVLRRDVLKIWPGPKPARTASDRIAAETAESNAAHEPLRGKALDDALDEWVLVQWGADLTKLPPREELLSHARKKPKFSKVTDQDIRALRRRHALDVIKREAAGCIAALSW